MRVSLHTDLGCRHERWYELAEHFGLCGPVEDQQAALLSDKRARQGNYPLGEIAVPSRFSSLSQDIVFSVIPWIGSQDHAEVPAIAEPLLQILPMGRQVVS